MPLVEGVLSGDGIAETFGLCHARALATAPRQAFQRARRGAATRTRPPSSMPRRVGNGRASIVCARRLPGQNLGPAHSPRSWVARRLPERLASSEPRRS